METVALHTERRSKGSKANKLRWDRKIPAVLYGHGRDTVHLQIDYQTFRRAYNKAGMSTIIDMDIAGENHEKVLVQEVQYDPVTDETIHVDFVFVRMDEKISTRIPLEFVGQAPAVKEMAGVLDIKKHDIEVKCLPEDLISSIQVDISPLVDFNVVIHVSDINVPERIEVLHEPEQAIVTVIPPRVEEESVAPAVAESTVLSEESEKEEESSENKKGD